MGQTRSVSAYKYISRNTIEEKILALQAKKTNLSEALVSPGDQALSILDEATVRSLFA
jgi:SNF2 family DNA or RNA helicase